MNCPPILSVLVAVLAGVGSAGQAWGDRYLDGRKELLQSRVSDADRIRVRSGGTCHRRIEEEETLFEVQGSADVTKILEMIAVDEDLSGESCGCCGNPTLEFYRNDSLVASIGVHHGYSLRWVGGWSGDSVLEPESAERLTGWLAEHGVKQLQEEWREESRRRIAEERRYELYTRVIPEPILLALEDADSEEMARTAFTSHVTGADAAELYFRILGGPVYAWGASDEFERFLVERMLPDISGEDVLIALERVADDKEAMRGAARWLLWHAKWATLESEQLQKYLPALGRAGLSHPDEKTRRMVLWALWQIGTPGAQTAIRSFAWSNVPPVEATVEDMTPPTNQRTLIIQAGMVKSEKETTAAVVYLSKLGDKQSLKIAERLLDVATEADRELLTEAVKRMKEP